MSRLLLLGTAHGGGGGEPPPPEPPQTDLFAHYAADRIPGAVDAALLAEWPDLGPNGYDLAAAGAERPTFRAAQANDLPTVQFSAGNIMFRDAVPNPGSSFFTAWLMFRNPADTTANIINWNNDAPGNADNIFNQWLPFSDGQIYFQHGDATLESVVAAEPAGLRGALYHIVELHKAQGGASVIKVNGVQRAAGNLPDDLDVVPGGARLAMAKTHSADFAGFIGEVILYAPGQSEADRAATQQYLSDKWSFGL